MSRECILIGAVEHMSVECSSRGSEVLRAGPNQNLLGVSWARSAACDTSRLVSQAAVVPVPVGMSKSTQADSRAGRPVMHASRLC